MASRRNPSDGNEHLRKEIERLRKKKEKGTKPLPASNRAISLTPGIDPVKADAAGADAKGKAALQMAQLIGGAGGVSGGGDGGSVVGSTASGALAGAGTAAALGAGTAAAAGAGTAAATGATMGAAAGPMGLAAGAAIGAGIGLLKGMSSKKKAKEKARQASQRKLADVHQKTGQAKGKAIQGMIDSLRDAMLGRRK